MPSLEVSGVHWSCVRAIERRAPDAARHWFCLQWFEFSPHAESDKVAFAIILYSFAFLLHASEARGFTAHPETCSVWVLGWVNE